MEHEVPKDGAHDTDKVTNIKAYTTSEDTPLRASLPEGIQRYQRNTSLPSRDHLNRVIRIAWEEDKDHSILHYQRDHLRDHLQDHSRITYEIIYSGETAYWHIIESAMPCRK